MVVIVTGANGQLGQAIKSISKNYPEIEFYFYSSVELDITLKNSVNEIFKNIKPDFCINAAAYTAVDKAELEIDKAYQINAIGVKNIAEIALIFNTTLIHVSTDFVFDGNNNIPYTENDISNPQSVYGESKRKGELLIQEILKNHFIIRTSWLYSKFGNNFMKTMLKLAKERTTLNVVNDQIGTPTQAVDLAEVLIKIILSKSKNFGIYHYSNEGSCSWYEFAHRIFEINNIKIDLNPITTSDYPTPAKRPKYSVLDKSKIKLEFNLIIKNWADSIESIA